MKSERRHELQHNELAQWLIGAIEAVKPHQNLILTVVTIAVVALGAYTWWSRSAADRTTQAWDDVNAAINGGSLDKLTKVVEDYPNTSAGHTAAVLSADIRLAGGCEQLFIRKAPAEQELSKAVELYQSDLQQGQTPMLRQRVTFGLARAKESKGDLESARHYYGELVKDWPHGTYAAAAQQRLDDLNRPETKRMYDDFAKYEPKPAVSAEPGLPGLPPSFDADLPKDRPESLPGLGEEPKPGGAEKAKAKGVEKAKKPAETTLGNALISDGSNEAKALGKDIGKAKKPAETTKPADSVKPADAKKK